MLQLAPILISLFTGYGLANDESSLVSRIPDLITHLCPGSHVCSSKRAPNVTYDKITFDPGTESCCVECSCLAECSKTDNCCFPHTVLSKNVTAGKVQNFQNGRSCLYPMIPQPETNRQLYQSFIMVSSVQYIPTGDLEGPFDSFCGDMNVAPWGSLYPVYSKKSNQIYKNIECARDNGDDADVILWNAVINCVDDVELNIQGITLATVGLNTNSISENCHVKFISPAGYEVLQPLKCYNNLIDTCSEGQDFQVPEGINISKDDIRILCTKSGFISPYRAYGLYANVFCHICNGEVLIRDIYCKTYHETLGSRFGTNGGFIALLDDKFITASRDMHQIRKEDLPKACFDNNVDSCRQVLCPTGQLRNKRRKCVYPNKIWYNQNYAVYINLTFDTFINITEVFRIQQGFIISVEEPPLNSVWMENWLVYSVHYREMDDFKMSNNLIIQMQQRLLPVVKPGTLITYIKKMIGKPWSIRLQNTTDVRGSAYFSTRSSFLREFGQKIPGDFDDLYNLTKSLEWPTYKLAYFSTIPFKKELIISRLYLCNQVELEPSEFVLNTAKNALFIYETQRVIYERQFEIVRSNSFNEIRVKICIEDSGLYESDKNIGLILGNFEHCFIVASLMHITVYKSIFLL